MCLRAAPVACSGCLHHATEHGHRSCAVISSQDALGSIACTGSNFLIRAAHLAEVGFFPTYTMVRLHLQPAWSAEHACSPVCEEPRTACLIWKRLALAPDVKPLY